MKQYNASVLIGSNSLKVLVARQKNTFDIVNFSVINTRDKSDEDLSAEFKKSAFLPLLNKSLITLVVPRHLATVRIMDFPATDPIEIQNMAEFQALRQVPYTGAEIVLGIKNIKNISDESTSVMMIILHKKIFESVLKLFSNLNLIPDKAVLSSESSSNFFCSVFEVSVSETDKNIGIVEIDCENSELSVLNQKTVAFSRSITEGAAYLNETSDIQSLIKHIKDSIDFYKTSGPSIDSLYLFAPDSVAEKSTAEFHKQISPEISHLDIKEKINIPEDSRQLLNDHSVVSMIGALLPNISVVDLLPSEIKNEKTKRLKKKHLTKTFIYSCFLFILLAIIGIHGIHVRNEYLKKINSAIKTLSPSVTKIQLMKDKIDLLRTGGLPSTTSLDVIHEIASILPSGIFIRTLSYSDQGHVSFKGIAPAIAPVFELIPKLEASPLFSKVKTRYTRKVKVRGKEYADFQIECTLSTDSETGETIHNDKQKS